MVMLPQWLPLLVEAGDLKKAFATPEAVDEVRRVSAATIDRYLLPVRARFRVERQICDAAGVAVT